MSRVGKINEYYLILVASEMDKTIVLCKQLWTRSEQILDQVFKMAIPFYDQASKDDISIQQIFQNIIDGSSFLEYYFKVDNGVLNRQMLHQFEDADYRIADLSKL